MSDEDDDAVNRLIDEISDHIDEGHRDRATAIVRRWVTAMPRTDAETLLLSVCWLARLVCSSVASQKKVDPTTVGAALAQKILTGLEPPQSLFENPPLDAAHRGRS